MIEFGQLPLKTSWTSRGLRFEKIFQKRSVPSTKLTFWLLLFNTSVFTALWCSKIQRHRRISRRNGMCNGFAYGYLNRHDPCCGAYCHVGIGPFCCVFFLMTWKGWLGFGEFCYSSLEAFVWGEWFGWKYQKVFQTRPEVFGVWGMFEGSEFALPHVVPHYQLTVSSW